MVVGQAPVAASIPLPAYKETVGASGEIEIVDYAGTRRRSATAIEAETLPSFQVGGVSGIPANVSAVVFNLTVTGCSRLGL